MSFDYIGPVTCFHLAKNLGVDVVKHDRHLVRYASYMGFRDATELCEMISRITGDRVAVVDLVLWRFATLMPAYERELVERFRPYRVVGTAVGPQPLESGARWRM